ncbi:uncharacterized protein LOC143287514 isoform X4 [Babylonia areolata]|uniref:uncharacterized protein LOC143287514 isoform X4 n=1 Tax=Babylonia areolata TaxID=304850 RepID=UPI003FD06ED7
MAGNKEKAAYENPGMQYDDDVASCQQESEPRSHSVSGEDTSTNQPSPAVRRDVDTTPSSLTGQGNGVTRSTIRHSEHHGGLVELLSVTALSDVRAAGQEEGDRRTHHEDSYVPQALEDFVVKKQGTEVKQIKSRKVRSYYKKQDNLIEVFEDLSGATAFQSGSEDETAKSRKLTTLFSKITFAVNLMLLGAKLAASILSSSMSIISSLVDSVVDLLSGVILLWAARAIKRRDPDLYPEGRSKLEPVSIVILSVVMGLASVQLIRESGEKIATLVSDHTALPSMELSTFIIAGSTVGSRNFQALTHLTGFIYTDPLGAILISSFIIYNWWKTGSEQVRLLTGHTASQAFHSQLTWICMNHDPRITHIDTLRAYHYGNNCLVKVDIVLPAAMCLREAHDIGESLQQKLESLPQVERAFVHVDYEFLHKPSSEHKTV